MGEQWRCNRAVVERISIFFSASSLVVTCGGEERWTSWSFLVAFVVKVLGFELLFLQRFVLVDHVLAEAAMEGKRQRRW